MRRFLKSVFSTLAIAIYSDGLLAPAIAHEKHQTQCTHRGSMRYTPTFKGWRSEENSDERNEIGGRAVDGKEALDANCAACHGRNAAGTKNGSPLVHDIYNPGHHSDDAFYFAVMQGVRRHHCPYGDMPPQPQVTEQQVRAIVQYVRELQIANGIRYRPHQM